MNKAKENQLPKTENSNTSGDTISWDAKCNEIKICMVL